MLTPFDLRKMLYILVAPVFLFFTQPKGSHLSSGNLRHCYRLDGYVPPKMHRLNVTVFGDKAFMEVIKVK